jgi:hypothetical protein
MSHFRCDQCGTDILEGDDGNYITECEHYPLKVVKISDAAKRRETKKRREAIEAVCKYADSLDW